MESAQVRKNPAKSLTVNLGRRHALRWAAGPHRDGKHHWPMMWKFELWVIPWVSFMVTIRSPALRCRWKPETPGIQKRRNAMATTSTQAPAQAPPSRPCPHCADALTIPPCENCGWEPGLVPVALTQTPEGPMTTFAAEKRHKFMFIFGVLSCILGVMFLVGGISAGAAGNVIAGIIFGPLVFAAGVMTLKNTHGGKAWWGLSAKEKGWAVPGLICGGFLGLCIIPALLIFWLGMAMLPKPGRDF
jgi:hypothetical protein